MSGMFERRWTCHLRSYKWCKNMVGDITRNDLALYDHAAGDWWSGETRWIRTLQNMVPARLAFFEREIGGWTGLNVLDVGCAGGFMAEAIAARGASVRGVDPARQAIIAAQRHASGTSLRVSYDVGVGENLPYPDAVFDRVVCVDVLEHVGDVNGTIAEIARVLKPGGHFLFDTINRNAMARFVAITVAEDMVGILPRGTHDPHLFIKPRELRALLAAHGFAVGVFAGLGPVGLNSRFDPVFGTLPFTTVSYMGTAVRNANVVA